MAMAPDVHTYTKTEYTGNYNWEPVTHGPYAWGKPSPVPHSLRHLFSLPSAKIHLPAGETVLQQRATTAPAAATKTWMKRPENLPSYAYTSHQAMTGAAMDAAEVQRIKEDTSGYPNTKLWQTWKSQERCLPETVYSHQLTTDYHYPYARAPYIRNHYITPSDGFTNRGNSWKLQFSRSGWLENGSIHGKSYMKHHFNK